jgi:Fe-S oxidoreductase
MATVLISPAEASFLFMPGFVLYLLIPIVGIAVLAHILWRRFKPLAGAAPDFRFDRIKERIWKTYESPHHRMPRYFFSGAIHITILVSLMALSIRVILMVLSGVFAGLSNPDLGGVIGTVYGALADIGETVILVACVVAVIRRGIFKPERYSVPERYGKDRSPEAIWYMVMIGGIALCDMFHQGSLHAATVGSEGSAMFVLPGTGAWMAGALLTAKSEAAVQNVYLWSFFAFDILVFAFLCLLPFGRLFHLFTGAPNVFFSKLRKGTVKPVKWGVPDEKVEELESFGVKKLEEFTWKHLLDFYSCADCGRCSDQCPANAVGRPLSPRFISLKGRAEVFRQYPAIGKAGTDEVPIMGGVYNEDEIWSCTTCGACEEECPVSIEYIDKIVDLRRGMVDEGMVPQSLQKPLRALEKRGNPYGKMERKRTEWTKEMADTQPVKVVGKKETADTLFFVDSATSYDDQVQGIGEATARIIGAAGIDFGILGPLEKDSGHDVRRFGEEMLFMELRDQNTDAILASDAREIVTADPHAYNALKNDYVDLPPVLHISELIAREVKAGRLRLRALGEEGKVYTYHDPCYLGRHNGLYDVPRDVLDAIPNLKRVEMEKSRDRSFCCGGGGLMLFYEPIEESRMGSLRVKMAEAAGANVIVTACPFCMINVADAIKTSGLEGKMEVMDLAELVARQLDTAQE